MRRIRPDILHLQNGLFPNYLGLFANYHPLCFTGWNGDILWQPHASRLYRLTLKLLLRRADVITVNSAHMAQVCRFWSGQPGKIHLIHCPGVDTSIFVKQDCTSLKQDLSIPDGPVILSMRSLDFGVYNIDTLIRAIPRVIAMFPFATFVFLWHSGTQLKEVKTLVETLGVKDHVRLVGNVPHHELPRYINLATVAVSVSSHDSCPQSMLEAMSCQVPLVMGDIPTIREWIQDNRNGLLVPLQDADSLASALIRLLNDKELLAQFSARNLQWVRENADYSQEMAKMESIYYQLHNKKGGQ